jgi:hypothetical protein
MERIPYYMNNKRGSAHLEMILSFVIFIGFIFFILIFIRPYGQSTLATSVSSGIYENFKQNTSTELTTLFLKLNGSHAGCINISLPSDMMKYDAISSAVYGNGVKIDSVINSNILSIGETNEDSLYVYISPEFSPATLSACSTYNDYTWGGILEEKAISNRSLFEMAERYENDYDGLKSELGVPGIFEFGISSEILTMERTIPKNLDVIVKEYNEKVVFASGEIKNVRFRFSLW